MSLKKFLKNLVAVAIFALLFLVVDVRQVAAALGQLTVGTISYLLLISVALVYISALKWNYFLEAFGAKVSALRLFGLYLVGYFVNLLMPSYIGGDLARSWYLGRRVGQHEALTATILERYTGIVAMVGLALIFMWGVQGVTVQMRIAVILVALGLAGITIIALSPKLLDRLEAIPKVSKIVAHLRKIQGGFNLARRDRLLLLKAFALSFLFHTMTVVNTVATAYAVGWTDPPVRDLFVVLPLILLIGALPISPSGLGIQEGAFFFFLHALGATEPQALAVAVVIRAKGYVLAMFGGVVWMFTKTARSTDEREIELEKGTS